jgi:uncharacterized spore protein YtfJ
MDVPELLARAQDTMTVSRAFGTPHEHNGTLIIPVAIVVGGGGGGVGEDDGTLVEAPTQRGGRRGSGGGFGSASWPIGVYTVTNGNVRWVPAIDPTRIVLAVIALMRAVVRVRGRRAGR